MEISHVSADYDHDAYDTVNGASGTDSSTGTGDKPSVTSVDSLLTRVGALIDQRINALSQGNNTANSFRNSYPRNRDRVPGMKPGEIDRLMREHKCFRCKQPGHFKSECPQTAQSKK
jgi:hypothetical protein